MNASLKYVFATVLLTGTAFELLGIAHLATSVRGSVLVSRSQASQEILSKVSSTAVNPSGWASAALSSRYLQGVASQLNIRAAFAPSPNPAPVGTGGTGTR